MPSRGVDEFANAIKWIAGFGFLWVLAAQFSERIGSPAIWFALGLYLGFLLISPKKLWPLLALTALAADTFRSGRPYFPHLLGWTADTIAIFVVIRPLRRLIESFKAEIEPNDQFWLKIIFLAGFLLPALTSSIFALEMFLDFPERELNWRPHFVSCFLAIVTVVPLILTVREKWLSRPYVKAQTLTKDCLTLVVLLLSVYAFSALQTRFLVYPILIWISLQGRLDLTVCANLILTVSAIYGEPHLPSSPLISRLRVEDRHVFTQLFVAISSFTNLLFTSLVAQQKRHLALVNEQSKKLEIANQKFQVLFEQASDGIFLTDSEDRYIEVNSRACEMTGYSRATLTQMKIPEIFLEPANRPDTLVSNKRHLQHGDVLVAEDFLKRGDGKVFPVEITAKRLSDGRIQAFIRDISERKLSEDRLRRSEMEFRLLAESVPSIVFSTDREGSFQYVSKQWSTFTGCNATLSEWLCVVHPDDLKRIDKTWIKSAATGADWELEFRIRAADGNYHWFLCRAKALTLADGKVDRWVGSLTNIQAQKMLSENYRAQSEVVANERKWLEIVLNAIPTPLSLVVPESGQTVFANPAANRIMGKLEPQAMPAGIFKDANGNPLTIAEYPHSQVALHGKLSDSEIQYVLGTESFWLLFSGTVLPALDAHPPVCVLSYHDVTKLKSVESQLRRSNQDLELFASIASHDLKEPLRTVASYAKLLALKYQNVHDKDAQEFTHFILDGTYRMKGLIEQLLEYAQAGKSSTSPTFVNCNQVLQRVLFNLKILVEERRAEIVFGELPTISGRPAQVEQVYQNLISNAIKYNKANRPQVQISCSNTAGRFTFSIKDNGIGISEADQGRIFEAFQRVHGRSEFSGTGLGLAVCKRIIDANHGKIWVDSAPGEGSNFRFTWPAHLERTQSSKSCAEITESVPNQSAISPESIAPNSP